jgi:hypothetical protein
MTPQRQRRKERSSGFLEALTPAGRERRGEACTHPSRAHIGKSDGQIDASTGCGTASDCLRGPHPRRIGTGQQLSPGSLHGWRRGFSFAALPPTKKEPRPRARIRGPAAPAGTLPPAARTPLPAKLEQQRHFGRTSDCAWPDRRGSDRTGSRVDPVTVRLL